MISQGNGDVDFGYLSAIVAPMRQTLPCCSVPSMCTLYRLLLALLTILLIPTLAVAQTEPSTDFDLFFLGYETEPGMDFGGRTLVSLHSGISRAIGSIRDVGERHPGVAPAWEFPIGAAILLVQHEVGGHGGRAREFGLGPSYGFGWDFSGYTSTARSPRTNEELMLLAAGGTESDQVLARRVLLDLLRPEGADGAKIPLAFMAKLDLTVYIAGTPRPESGEHSDFTDEFENGNDIAIYLVGRQGQRMSVPAEIIWNNGWTIDYNELLLEDNWNDARFTAAWNLLDPSLVAAVFAYFRDHVLRGEDRVHAPMRRLAPGSGITGITVGTRGALGPQSVSRFLDLHAVAGGRIYTVYVRDLDSSEDQTFGGGLGVRGLRLGRLDLALSADVWAEPESQRNLYEGTGWNATAEVDALLGDRWGLSARLGAKSEGFLPGLPTEDGLYVGFGVLAGW